MKDYLKIKKFLFDICIRFVQDRSNTVNDIIESNKKALFSETKSSAGDKHETGRAMLQLEMEKASQQLVSINQMTAVLNKISFKRTSNNVSLGSLIVTDKETYYLAISIGKVSFEMNDYFVVSSQSPIGKQLLGKQVGDTIPFNKAVILKVE